ncbi:hypothetical protein ACFX12_022026 [Malus domestica]
MREVDGKTEGVGESEGDGSLLSGSSNSERSTHHDWSRFKYVGVEKANCHIGAVGVELLSGKGFEMV